MGASAFVRQLEARSARMNAMNEAYQVFADALRERFDSEGYAYQAGFFQSQLFSLAADRRDSTEELVRSMLDAANRLAGERVTV